MQTVSTIGLDIAKSVFQVHGVDANGLVVIRRQLKRRYVLAFFEKLPSCLVGIEACASSHHWSRELRALGHNVRLMPPAYVKPYVKRQKNDMADAEAICEAVTRANMRFVPIKTPEQQSGLVLHRTRHLFIRQQTSVINAIRAHLAEFGVTAPVGRKGIEELLRIIADPSDKRVPDVVRACLAALGSQLLSLKKQILDFDRMIMAWHRSNQTSKRLNCIPGVGPLLATALVASVADPIRPQLLGLDRASTQTALERGSGQARQYQQARRSLSAQPVRGRRTRRHPLCQDSRHQASALGYSVTHAATHQGRSHRACQQACPNGLGHDGFGRAVQLSGRTEGLTRSRRVSWRDVKVGEGEQHVMQSRSIRRSGQPTWATALLNARF
jgi:transposase